MESDGARGGGGPAAARRALLRRADLAARGSSAIPGLSRAAIRLALLWLAVGATSGALLLARPPGQAGAWLLGRALHVDGLLFGWLVQFAVAVAHWILPRLPGRPTERGREGSARLAVLALNLGVIAVALSPALPSAEGWVAAGRALETVGLVAFAWHAAPRVRAATGA